MSWHDVIAMPIRSFWSLVKQGSRLEGEEQISALEISVASQSGDLAKTLHERYSAQATAKGESATAEKRFDPNVDHAAGIARMKLLMPGS